MTSTPSSKVPSTSRAAMPGALSAGLSSLPQHALKVIGYIRVSTDDQGLNGAGMESQRQQIEAECERRGWELLSVEQDVASGGTVKKRLGLERALTQLETGQAQALVVAKLDRLSRSLADFATLVERSRKHRWELVVLDLAVDTTTPNGEAMAGMLAVFAQWERRLIGQRTKEALAIKRAQGVRLGRPPLIAEDTRRLIAQYRRDGCSYAAIANALNVLQVPTAHGGQQWWRSTVRAVVADPSA